MLKLHSIFNRLLNTKLDNMLSVYLNTDPAIHGRNNRSAALIWLKDTLKEFKRGIPLEKLSEFEELQKKLINEVEYGELSGKSLIAFLSKDFSEIAYPHVDVNNELWWGKPSLGQLDWILEEYRNYGIVKIEQEKLHFYVVALNQVYKEWVESISEDTLVWQIKHTPPEKYLREKAIPGLRGGDTKEIVERHMNEEIQKFWKQSSSSLEKMRKNYYIYEIILAGLDSQTELFQKSVNFIDMKIIGHIHYSKDMTIKDIVTAAREIFKKYEREGEQKLINEIIERSDTKTEASLGIKNVLKVIQEGRAGIVALTNTTDKILIECMNCGYIMTKDAKECKQCSSKNLRIGSIKTLLPPLLRKYKVAMNIVSDNISEKFSKHGIGVLWRY